VQKTAMLAVVLAGLGACAVAQAQTVVSSEGNQRVVVYRVNVVSRTTRAVSYKHRSGSTKIDFAGTDLMAAAQGEARVKASAGRCKSKPSFPASSGPRRLATSI
jgi:hypothetical protein